MAYFECVIGGGGTSLTIQITTSSTVLYGQTITISKGGSTVGTTAFDNTGSAEYTVRESGTYTVSVTYSGTTFSNTVEVTDTFDTEIYATPDGSTVTPVNDIQIWLHCGNVWNKNYTTISQVLSDTTTLLALINSNNAVDYMVRSHDWCDDVCDDATAMTYIGANDYAADTLLADDNPGLVPTMTSNTTPSGEVSANLFYEVSQYYPWKAFNPSEERGWFARSTGYNTDDWIAYEFPDACIVKRVSVSICLSSSGDSTVYFKIQGSNDGFVNDIDDLCSEQTLAATGANTTTLISAELSTSKAYKSYRLINTKGNVGSSNGWGIKIQFYAKDGSWLESICNSTYFESVLNVKVPTMTSLTTPSGQIIYSSYYTQYADTNPLYAFDSTTGGSNRWMTNQAPPQYIGYMFTSAVKVNFVKLLTADIAGPKTSKIQGSNTNDTNDWHDIDDFVNCPATRSWYSKAMKNTTGYLYYRIYITEKNGNYTGSIDSLQFYGRAAS